MSLYGCSQCVFFFFFKQKTAYEMRISDWSSDVCSSDLRGYIHHPQLERFRSHASPRLAINTYLAAVHSEACARGYAFDRDKIGPVRSVPLISVQRGQIQHEWAHLLAKLAARSPISFEQWRSLNRPTSHPLFCLQKGGVTTWESVWGVSNNFYGTFPA